MTYSMIFTIIIVLINNNIYNVTHRWKIFYLCFTSVCLISMYNLCCVSIFVNSGCVHLFRPLLRLCAFVRHTHIIGSAIWWYFKVVTYIFGIGAFHSFNIFIALLACALLNIKAIPTLQAKVLGRLSCYKLPDTMADDGRLCHWDKYKYEL